MAFLISTEADDQVGDKAKRVALELEAEDETSSKSIARPRPKPKYDIISDRPKKKTRLCPYLT